MSDFILQLRQQEKLHRKSGANGLADLFMNAANDLEQKDREIEQLRGANAVLYNQWNEAHTSTVYERKLKKERDTLSAHVERLNESAKPFITAFATHRGALARGGDYNLKKLQEFLDKNEVVPKSTIGDWRKLFEAFNQSPETSLAKHDANLFEFARIPKHAKAGCIGEFKIIEENANICPECVQKYNPDCEVCMGESDENGAADLDIDVPWDTCKEIWKAMNKIKAEEIRRDKDGGS